MLVSKPWEALHALITRLGTSPLVGQTVLLVGGASGTGLELSQAFARSGCKLALCGRDPLAVERARVELAAYGAAVIARSCDATSAAQVDDFVQAVLQRFGSLDVLVTCGEADEACGDPLETALADVLRPAYRFGLAVLPHMRERRAGRIVHVSATHSSAANVDLAEATACAALTGFSSSLRDAVEADNIAVSNIETPSHWRERSSRAVRPADSQALVRSVLRAAAQSRAQSAHKRAFHDLRSGLGQMLEQVEASLSRVGVRFARPDPAAPAVDSLPRSPLRTRGPHHVGQIIAGPSTLLRATSTSSRY